MQSRIFYQSGVINRILAGSVICLYGIIVLLPPLFAAKWGMGHDFYTELSKSFALMAFAILFLQPVLAARLRFLDSLFGLDAVLQFHRSMGILAFGLLIFHPLLIAIGNQNLGWLFELNLPWNIWMGKIALFLLTIHIFISIFRKGLHLSFEVWRGMHDFLGASILVLAFVHSWFTGDDIELFPLQIFWWILGSIGIATFVWHRFFIPWKLSKVPYDIEDVIKETHNTWTLQFRPSGPRYHYWPGQFHFIRFIREGALSEEHHFTISGGLQTNGNVTSTIKESGDFTKNIGKIQKGDQAIIQGAYGSFSYCFYPWEKDLVFIAGGIGITPVMRMLREMRSDKFEGRVLLLYANKTQKDIVFQEELKEMMHSSDFNLQVISVLSEEKGSWEGESGHIDKEMLKKYGGAALSSKSFYICGPQSMNLSIGQTLRELGVPLKNIHGESFSLLEDLGPVTLRTRQRQWISRILICIFLVTAFWSAGVKEHHHPMEHSH